MVVLSIRYQTTKTTGFHFMRTQPIANYTRDLVHVRRVKFQTGLDCYTVRTDQAKVDHTFLIDGLMLNVTYHGESIRMSCGGKESYGDASGAIQARQLKGSGPHDEEQYFMPADAVYQAPLAYNNERKVFCIAGYPDFVIERSDYLLLPNKRVAEGANAHPMFGWKVKPEGAPDLSNV